MFRESEVMTANEQALNRKGHDGFMYCTACLQDLFGQHFPLSMVFSTISLHLQAQRITNGAELLQ